MMWDNEAYTFDQLTLMIRGFLQDGYVKGKLDELIVTPGAGGLTVNVGTGRARVLGRWYNNPSQKTLTLNDSGSQDRIDRIVLRYYISYGAPAGDFVSFILTPLTGMESDTPTPPPINATGGSAEISLAQVRVRANASGILTTDITDERNDYSVCGAATVRTTNFSNITLAENLDFQGKKAVWVEAPTDPQDLSTLLYLQTTCGPNPGQNKCEIVPIYGVVIPTGWLECNGQSVSRAAYPNLFTAFGTTFGTGLGDGLTFSLPDLRGRMIYGSTTVNTKAGAKTVTLTSTTMPTHYHAGGYPGSSVSCFTAYGSGGYGGGSVALNVQANAGSDAAHNNLSPYLVIRYFVRGT